MFFLVGFARKKNLLPRTAKEGVKARAKLVKQLEAFCKHKPHRLIL